MPGQVRDSSLSPCLRVYTCVSVPRCVYVCLLYVSVFSLMSLRVFVYLARRCVPQKAAPMPERVAVSSLSPCLRVYMCVSVAGCICVCGLYVSVLCLALRRLVICVSSRRRVTNIYIYIYIYIYICYIYIYIYSCRVSRMGVRGSCGGMGRRVMEHDTM